MRTQHDFYHDTEQNLNSLWFRGRVECDEERNRIKFRLPELGDLYGNADYKLTLRAVFQSGATQTYQREFHTENPGLLIRVNQLMSHKKHCGGWFADRDRCDIYVGAVTSVGLDEVTSGAVPDRSNDFANAPTETPLVVDVPTVHATTTPVGRFVRLNLVGMDSDGDGAKNFVTALGTTVAALAPFDPRIGAAGTAVAIIGNALPNNEDDLIDQYEEFFEDNRSRWGTELRPNTSDPYYWRGIRRVFGKEHLSAWIRIEEFPASWKEPPVIN